MFIRSRSSSGTVKNASPWASMASQTSVRQASRVIQSNRLHLNPSRTRNYSSRSVFTSSPSFRTRPIQLPRQYAASQARYLSLWNSKPTTPPPADTPQADLSIKDPSEFDRTIRASDNVSADASFESHPANSIEPKFISDAQHSLLEPHGTDAAPMPNLEEIPERIGYLKQVCGLDFGWGPSSIMEWSLEHIHIWGGLSWTASCIMLGVALRSVMFPFLVGAADQSGRMRAMSTAMAPLQAGYREAVRDQDKVKMSQFQMEIRAVKNEHGVNFKKAFYPLLIQIPFGFGAWRTLSNSAALPVPGFVTESWLWTSDLSFSDPYFIMPALSSLAIYITLRMNKNARAGSAAATGPDLMAILGKAMPLLSFVFVSFQPGAVQLYFVSSAATGLVTAWLLQNGIVRSYLKLPLLPNQQPASNEPVNRSTEPGAAPFMRTRSSWQGKSQSQVLEAQARVIEEEEAKAAQENRSGIDKVVDSAKGQWLDIKKHGSGFMETFTGKVEERREAETKRQREKYEARVRASLEEQRAARNRDLGIEETKREGGRRRH